MHCAPSSIVALWELYRFVGEALGCEVCFLWGCGEMCLEALAIALPHIGLEFEEGAKPFGL
jgi:hypothetical protein